MAKPFLITGLPRSRTTWMAAFFSTFPAYCHHDPMIHMSHVSELHNVYNSDFYAYMGVSDTGAGFFMPWIMENINPRTVIIERDIDFVDRELNDLGFPMGGNLNLLLENLRQFKNHPNVMWVPFEKLNDLATMTKIWFHLLPSIPFDEERYLAFNDFNITPNLDKMRALGEKNKQQILNLMKDAVCLS